MQPCNTILFDLDGTLLDSLEDLTDSVNRALAFFGYPPRSQDDVRLFIGNGAKQLIALSLPDGLEDPHFDETMAFFRADYTKNYIKQTRPYPGILPMLETLSQRGYKIGIVSNKPDPAVQALHDFFFKDLIPVAVGDAPERPRKPAPDPVYYALERLHAGKEQCVYVGDSETDIKTAANAGLPLIAVSWGFRDKETLRQNGATQIVDTVEELLQCF